MLRYVNIDKLLPMRFEMEFFSAKPSEPMLRLKFYQGSCLSCLNDSYATDLSWLPLLLLLLIRILPDDPLFTPNDDTVLLEDPQPNYDIVIISA